MTYLLDHFRKNNLIFDIGGVSLEALILYIVFGT